jgi:hypothetical protein
MAGCIGGAVMGAFSDFIRNAGEDEKREVYMQVIDGAIKRQLAQIPAGSMRVGPGTDAVVWRICPSHEAEL